MAPRPASTPGPADLADPARSARSAAAAGLLLWPGAGATRDHRTLVAVEQALASRRVARVDHGYRLAGRKAAGKAAVDIAGVADAVAAHAEQWDVDPARLVIGGRSYGGRMCSMAVAEGLAVAGLVLLSYPLHPPGKPERLRTGHFPDITVPTLFVSGERDPFGSPDEFAAWTPTVAGPVRTVWLPGAHDPRNDDAVADALGTWLTDLDAGTL